MLPNNYPEEFAENIVIAIFRVAAADYGRPEYREEVVRFLRSECADLISGGASRAILEMLENGIKSKKSTGGNHP